MILTITANAALDRLLFLPEFLPDTTMRTDWAVDSVGGKGFVTSVILQILGAPNLAMGFIAGPTGHQLERLLDDYGICHELIWVDGDTRISHVIVETDHNRHSHIVSRGYTILPSDQETFLKRFREQVCSVSWIVEAGSLPAGLPADFYGQLVEIAHQYGAKALIDCPGEPAVQAIPARPDILKLNLPEFVDTFSVPFTSILELEVHARRILEERSLPSLVITAGEDGILAVLTEGTYLASSPRQQPVSAAGAGDAVSAALTWRLVQGDSWPEALHWAAATSAAAVLTEGTADCRLEDVRRIYPQVSVCRVR